MVQNSYLFILHTNYMTNITGYDHQSWINVTQKAFMNRKSNTPTFYLVTGSKNDRGRQGECQEMQERDSNNSSGLEIHKQGRQQGKPLGEIFTVPDFFPCSLGSSYGQQRRWALPR